MGSGERECETVEFEMVDGQIEPSTSAVTRVDTVLIDETRRHPSSKASGLLMRSRN